MALLIKPGVRLLGLRPEMVVALLVADAVYEERAVELVVTSAVEGQHKRASLHYTGHALDLRRPAAWAELVRDDLALRLGDDYDVVLEADHIHVEFQPKVPY